MRLSLSVFSCYSLVTVMINNQYTDCKKNSLRKSYFWQLFEDKFSYIFLLVETKVEASKSTLFHVHRWSKSWDTSHCLKELKNELVQSRVFFTIVDTFATALQCKMWKKWTKWCSTSLENDVYLDFYRPPMNIKGFFFEASTFVSTNNIK